MDPRSMTVHWLIALFLGALAAVVAAIAAFAGWRPGVRWSAVRRHGPAPEAKCYPHPAV